MTSSGRRVCFLAYYSEHTKLFRALNDALPPEVSGEVKLVYVLTPSSLLQSSAPPEDLSEEDIERIAGGYVGMKLFRDPTLDSVSWRRRIRRRAVQWYRIFLHCLRDVDLLVTWSGRPIPLAAAVAAARRLGKRLAFCENGVIPGTVAIDPQGVNYECSLAGKDQDFYRSYRYDAAGIDQLFSTVWPQRALRKARSRGDTGAGDETKPLPERYVLYAMQVNDDSQIRMFSPRFPDMASAVTYTYSQIRKHNAATGDNLGLVVKEHPSDFGRADYTRLRESMPEVSFLRTTPIRDLIRGAKAVVTINSSVGVEALFSQVPVITLGQALYNVDGLVRYVGSGHELADVLPASLSEPLDIELRKHFLWFLWTHLLFPRPDKHPDGAVVGAKRIMSLLSADTA